MFVRSLRLSGFKSFADPTVMLFEPGINVVVGPNGSGKSNIADALQWVLGSQAPSAMRGASMEDVIFAGSEQRPPLGSAEVELTVDNSDRALPLDVAEVTIARYTDRAGVSEYRINGAPCRLLDITELLSDTGVGRTLHSLVGQGQLDSVLGARPEDRRAFIEEAAQIGKYRRRKERTLRKIERVDENLTRAADILAELRRSVRPLKRQASAARAHSELLAEQRTLRQRLAAAELQRLAADDAELDRRDELHRAELLSDELEHTRARLEAAAAERERTAAEAEDSARVLHRLARAADRLEGLGRVAAERAERIAARLAAETEESYRERIRLLEHERLRFGTESAGLRRTAQSAAMAASAAREHTDDLRAALSAAESAVGERRAREVAAAEALVRAEGAEAAGRASIGSYDARIAALVERRELGRGEAERALEAIAACEAEVQALVERLDGATEAAAAAEEAVESARAAAERLREQRGELRTERAAARARRDALREVAELLSDVPAVGPRLAPLLLEARERAATTAAAEADASRLVEHAEAVVEERWQEVARRDDDLRRLDALASGAAERLAGARRRREAREVELAALDDELSRARASLAQAQRAAAEERAALPRRRAALEEARAERVAAESALERERAEFEAAREALSDALAESRAAEERALAAQLRVEEAEAGIADAQGGLKDIAGRRASLQVARGRAVEVAELARIAAACAREWSSEAEERARNARAMARAAEERLVRLRGRERELQQSLEEIARRRNEADVRRAEIHARADALAERAVDEWGLRAEELLDMEPLPEEEREPARARIERLEREMSRLGPVNPRAAEEYAEAAERESFLVEQIDDLRASRRDLLKVVREVDTTIVQVFGDAYEKVSHEFGAVFERMFPGGRGELRLTDPEDLLGGGIDIDARPPGKNIRKLSLLSGGERSLVALAFLLSIFRSLPSPFYVLDEVEAALDDVNLQRFLELTEELQRSAQIMIVTHQKRTMEAADVLYGVTMGKGGVSTVVAQRIEEALV
jgi:chromosome segregation protein